MPDKKKPAVPCRNAAALYVAFQAFFSLFLWLPIFYEFQKLAGLPESQIIAIQSLYYLSFCLLEIPTGWVADRFGYRASLLLGSAVMVAANLIPAGLPTAAGMTVHFLTIALSRSLVSGAASAYLYEYLNEHGRRKDYKIIEGRGRGWGLIGRVLSWPFVGKLMQYEPGLPYLVTAVFSLIAFVSVLGLPPLAVRARHDPAQSEGKETQSLKAIVSLLVRSPALLVIMGQGVLLFVMGRLQITFFQPLMAEKSWGLASFGTILAVMTLFEALGSFAPSWLAGRNISDGVALNLLTTLLAASLIIVVLAGPWGAVAGFCLFCLLIGIVCPIQKQLINQLIPEPRYRATILSVESLIDRLASAAVIALLAPLGTRGNLGYGIVAFSVLTAIVMIPGGMLAQKTLRFNTRPTSRKRSFQGKRRKLVLTTPLEK